MREQVGTRSSLVVAGVALIACCYGLARFAYGLFLPDLTTEFRLTPSLSGLIGSGSYVAYCVAIVAGTLATARLGPRPVAVAAGVLATAGILTVATAPNAVVLAIGVLVAGSSTGVASPPLAAAIAVAVREGSRDTAQTVVNAGTGVGVLVSGPLAVLLLGHWRAAWFAFAAVTALVTVQVWRTVPGGRPGLEAPEANPRRSAPRRAMALLCTAAVVLGLGSVAVWTFGRQVVVDAGAAAWVSPVVWTAIGAAGIAGATAGPMVRRLGIRSSWALGMLALAAAGTGLAVGAATPVLAILSGAVFGAAYIALSGVLLLWATRVRPDRPAAGVGVAFFALAVGQAVGAPLAGAATEVVPLVGVFVACAAVTVVGALLGPPPPASGAKDALGTA